MNLVESDMSSFRILNRFLYRAGFTRFIVVFLVAIILLALVITGVFLNLRSNETEVFIGVMVGFGRTDEIVSFVDEVEEYVNLIIISELNITTNATALYEIFDYLHARGLYFIPFMSLNNVVDDPNFFQVAGERWGEHFLGVYTFDEPGGKQIDVADHRPINEAKNYDDAASKYIQAVCEEGLVLVANNFNLTDPFTIFTSDYALYWWDYIACYNVVFSQFGWNNSRQLNVALCRGAATGHNSEWGAIVTWTYKQPPYLGSTNELYRDMVLAYDNGAKYIIVFNFPTNVTEYGVLTQDHLEAIQKFWNYHKVNSQPEKYLAEVAYVLPENYGYGFRANNDRIWGLWGPDEFSLKIWNDVNHLLEFYGSKLDIIYETAESSIKKQYKLLIFWNGTEISND
jgi:hypothetical protein